MRPKIDSVASLKRLPIGTKLVVVASLMGPCAPKARTLVKVRSKDLVFRVDEPGPKFGQESYLGLPSGTTITPIVDGFEVHQHDEAGCVRYLFVD